MSAFDLPINHNPLRTRADVELGLLELLAPLANHYADGGFNLGNSGVRYSPLVARLEGWSRVLWGIGPLLAGGGGYPELERHLEVFRRGVDPHDPAYWGEPKDSDQRLVEMAAMGLALILAPDRFWTPLGERDKANVYAWLSTIEKRRMPPNNWHFFRVLVCLAFRALGLPVDEAAERESLELIDSQYRDDGWYQDGTDGNFDYYNPFGFHFYGLVYARLAGDRDPVRSARFRERARLFAAQFLPWLREDGSVVPYGRSLAYRFAIISFFSACAFAGEEVVPWPVLKGIVLRNLRWWISKPIFDAEGSLTIGHAYPNLIMAEQYNSPGSPYWCCKTFLVLALGEEHPFWRAEEDPLPELPPATSLAVPKYLLSRSKEDVFLLCPGRYPGFEMVQAAAKFCKFAYSARFGFCVSQGSYSLEKTGCDSMLVLSEGDGYWRERRHTEAQECGPNWTFGRWKPWPDVTIETTLVALGAWHVRVHRIVSARRLETAEGGFSVPLFDDSGRETPPRTELRAAGTPSTTEAGSDAAVAFPWGASRIVDLSPHATGAGRRGEILTLEPNLNVISPTATLPILRAVIEAGDQVLACAVRAGDEKPTLAETPPTIRYGVGGAFSVIDGNGVLVARFE